MGNTVFKEFNMGGGGSSQVETMPVASAALVGTIVQYVGVTDSSYTNGYFYKCVSDGEDPATYSWSRTDVQPSTPDEISASNVIFEDEEDAQTKVTALEQKVGDREATETSMGYVLLDPSKTFAEQVTEENTIYEIRDTFNLDGDSVTLPDYCTLLFNGGSIGGGTINLNDCHIEGTYGWIQSDLTVMGKPSCDVYPEWYADSSDADKITRAIDDFASIRLGLRDYHIDKPIQIHHSFKIVGNGIPDFFGEYGNTSPDKIVDFSGSRLLAENTDCILNITGVATSKFMSFVIDGVSFFGANNAVTDGIRFSTPSGPSRPISIEHCNFRGLRYGIYIYGSDPSHSTNVCTINIRSCNMTNNHWGIYATGNHAINGMVITSCNLEQNIDGGIYMSDADYPVLYGYLLIENCLLEGQDIPFKVRAFDSLIIVRGCYLETASRTTEARMINSDGEIHLIGNLSSTGAANHTFHISGPNSMPNKLYISGIVNSNKYVIDNCRMMQDADGLILNNTAEGVIYSHRGYSNNASSRLTTFDVTPDTIVDGVASFKTFTSTSLFQKASLTIEENSTYCLVFWLVSNTSSSNAIELIENLKTSTTYISSALPVVAEKPLLVNMYFRSTDAISGARLRLRHLVRSGNMVASNACIVKVAEGTRGMWGFNAADETGAYTDLVNVPLGFTYYERTLGKWIMYNGSEWTNLDGTPLVV